MSSLDRRTFIKRSLVTASVASLASQHVFYAEAIRDVGGIIDTNINLFDWPFRALKYRHTKALVAKLKKHRIIEAWAGSFEALFSKDMIGVNERLAAECQEHGSGFLIPFGSVNLAWPDWQEDLRRCQEVHKMAGVRIYPGYQPFNLDHPEMERLIKMTSDRGLILQVVFGMEDPRVHHPNINVGPVTLAPLVKALNDTPTAKVQLLHFNGNSSEALSQFMAKPNTFLDISRLEGNGAIGRMIGTIQGLPSAHVSHDRILFGSHAPYFPVETAIFKLVESPLAAEPLHAIIQGNARRLSLTSTP
ncbi:MAG: amidohydrolase family protein [Limisphaerales bacterium]